mmetsp:Transcript_22185/g.57172  ORF Transcript_22185/g.57172 Transcript_22185/m.57172 type:complete len:134 (-) Transcript_22185:420-821(-)
MGTNSGSILVWQRSDRASSMSTVTPLKLVDPDGAEYDVMGRGEIALSSDGLVLAAGSPQDDDMGRNSGSILVWQRPDLSVSFSTKEPVKLVTPDGTADDVLGYPGVVLSSDGLVLAAVLDRDGAGGRVLVLTN